MSLDQVGLLDKRLRTSFKLFPHADPLCPDRQGAQLGRLDPQFDRITPAVLAHARKGDASGGMTRVGPKMTRASVPDGVTS
jgi:hypothetical protein